LAFLVAAALFAHWYFALDKPPSSRQPLDQTWEQFMLAGRSARWVNGQELPWTTEMEDRIANNPVGARLTTHAIVVESRGGYVRGSWYLVGGLIGRADLFDATVELFSKQIVREHWLGYVKWDEDYSYEFFLLLRSRATGRAHVVRRWAFPPEEVALAVQPEVAARIRELANSEEEAVKRIKQQRSHYLVSGRLQLDPGGPKAVVTILGMVRPIEYRVSLASAPAPASVK